ncbi:MAG TPA: hypothetical protein VG295_05390 [Solirubrobacteraceae bacterium]|nr:hypothetical protein [Solirubrobacteraceae bacterium]
MPESPTPKRRAFGLLAIGAAGVFGLVAAAGLYSEAVRVPDQP